jgi:hypothetical protein
MSKMFTTTVRAFQQSGMHVATSRKLRTKFVRYIVATMEGYVLELERGLGHAPSLDKPKPPPRMKLEKKKPKGVRESRDFGLSEVYLRQQSVQGIIMMINSLDYVQKEVLGTLVEREVIEVLVVTQQELADKETHGVKGYLEQFMTSDGGTDDIGRFSATVSHRLTQFVTNAPD